jgi:hypothetical protein
MAAVTVLGHAHFLSHRSNSVFTAIHSFNGIQPELLTVPLNEVLFSV